MYVCVCSFCVTKLSLEISGENQCPHMVENIPENFFRVSYRGYTYYTGKITFETWADALSGHGKVGTDGS